MQRRLTVRFISQDLVLSIRRILQIEDEQPERQEDFLRKGNPAHFVPQGSSGKRSIHAICMKKLFVWSVLRQFVWYVSIK